MIAMKIVRKGIAGLGMAVMMTLAVIGMASAHNVPADKLASDGLQKAPLPADDFNTRIVLFGHDPAQARTLADALSKRPWHNVTYFPGTYEALRAAIK